MFADFSLLLGGYSWTLTKLVGFETLICELLALCVQSLWL